MDYVNEKRISELVIDEWIWVVFIILSILNITGDECEKKYCYNNSIDDKIRARRIFKFTVFVSFLVYSYLAYLNCCKYREAKINNKNSDLSGIRCISSLLVVVASVLSLSAQVLDSKSINPSIK